jgi:hypothetical protein
LSISAGEDAGGVKMWLEVVLRVYVGLVAVVAGKVKVEENVGLGSDGWESSVEIFRLLWLVL